MYYLIGAVVGGYVLTSAVFLRFPHILHKKKKTKFRAMHISHRGGAAESLENTMEAFKLAESVGTDMFELDCQITRDGQVVVSHDNHLMRVCGVDMKISETDYKELPSLKEKIKVDFFQLLHGSGSDRRIPLLEEVFTAWPSMPINVDIKEDDDQLMHLVNDLVKKYEREGITVWGNREDGVCKKLYALNPSIPLLFSVRQVVYVVLLFWSGLLPFVPFKESMLEVIMPAILLDSEELFDRSSSFKSNVLFWIMDKLIMNRCLISHLDRRGIQTYIWVLNRDQDYERALKLGAAGIMTDRITHLADYLQRREQSGQSLYEDGDDKSKCC